MQKEAFFTLSGDALRAALDMYYSLKPYQRLNVEDTKSTKQAIDTLCNFVETVFSAYCHDTRSFADPIVGQICIVSAAHIKRNPNWEANIDKINPEHIFNALSVAETLFSKEFAREHEAEKLIEFLLVAGFDPKTVGILPVTAKTASR